MLTPNQAFIYILSGVVSIKYQYWRILTPCSHAPDTIRELFSPVEATILVYVWKLSDGNGRLFINSLICFAVPLVVIRGFPSVEKTVDKDGLLIKFLELNSSHNEDNYCS
ncbi:hypothetical protein AVEN_121153-1 [Araneus ventricosus]|uniref:Uncharacterized protein n=1 Tax=Araneus ventricosus TaxID=182803 RepID=A0A4Y2E020_ARAVE|nr:hypothetical protein AVEN_121153-1 [Araneus ventricosus]